VTYSKINEMSKAPLSNGLQRPDVKNFKEDLITAGFTSWTNPNDYYGTETVKYVKEFQKYYGLEITGNGDETTLNKLYNVLNSSFQIGNSSVEIQKLKIDLMDLGFAEQWTKPNENYGSETVEVVKKFQSYYGLAVNGIIDSVTREKITSTLNSPFQLGNSSVEIQKLKIDLMNLGFADQWTKPNKNYRPE